MLTTKIDVIFYRKRFIIMFASEPFLKVQFEFKFKFYYCEKFINMIFCVIK